jgi:ATP-binding cassette, subfamily A (ABC1), member 3
MKLLAIGTCEELSARYANYEVHFACRSREDLIKAQVLMSNVPGARMADDVATRFEVPNESEGGLSLAQLFGVLASEDGPEYTVERTTLESVFLKVVRENDVQEEDGQQMSRSWWRFW